MLHNTKRPISTSGGTNAFFINRAHFCSALCSSRRPSFQRHSPHHIMARLVCVYVLWVGIYTTSQPFNWTADLLRGSVDALCSQLLLPRVPLALVYPLSRPELYRAVYHRQSAPLSAANLVDMDICLVLGSLLPRQQVVQLGKAPTD